MSAKIMGQVWDLKLSPAERIVLLAMADHADHDGNNVRPSIRLIVWKTDYSERQVKRIIKDLRDAGILVVTQGATPTTPYHYRIDLSAGIQKEPFQPSHRGVKMSPQDRGDKMSPGDIAMSLGGDTGDTPRGDIAMSPKPSGEPSLNHKRERAKRDAPAPKQSSMDSHHEAVTIYKELSGNRNIAPVVVSLIASKVTDMELWRRVVTSWCSQYRRDNFDGMFDWYEHPEKMNRKNGKVQLEPDRPSPPPYQPRDHKPTDTKRLAELRAKARESGK